MPNKAVPALAAAMMFTMLAPVSSAQWTVTILHPAASPGSMAFGADSDQQVGHWSDGVANHAALWSGSEGSWIDLRPAGSVRSEARAVFGNQQGGWADFGGVLHAGFWTGSSASWTSLHGSGLAESICYGLSGGQQVGTVQFADRLPRASIWTGTAVSRVDLHPSGEQASCAFATTGAHQSGYTQTGSVVRASLWAGSAASWIDLSPQGSTYSIAYSVCGTQQAGVALVAGVFQACIWNGTADSWTSLHPAGALSSQAMATTGEWQAGWVQLGGIRHASVWNGTPASWIDLHSLLPGSYRWSEAWGAWADDLALTIVGYAVNTAPSRGEAVMWQLPLCFAPQVVAHPIETIACISSSSILSVSVAGTAPRFQWRKNEIDIPGATAASYTIGSVTLADAGSYDCIITNACGTATSNAATLTVRTPQILTQPSSQTVNVDQPVFFALEADPQNPCFSALAYRWQRRNPLVEDENAPNAWLDLSDGGGFSGTQTPNLAIFRPTPGLATGYRCKITNACGCEADANGVIYTNTVNFAAACPSDFNNDGSVDGDDVIEFFERWDSGC